MLKVIKDNILVERIEDEEVTKAGLVIPNTAKGGVDKGVVRTIGDNISDVLIDDIIYFKSHMATEIHDKGTKYFVVKEELIIAIEK